MATEDGKKENLVTIPLCWMHLEEAGYAGELPREIIIAAGYAPHVRPRREEKRAKAENPLFVARLWVVEACHSWFNRFRKLTRRHEKNGPCTGHVYEIHDQGGNEGTSHKNAVSA